MATNPTSQEVPAPNTKVNLIYAEAAKPFFEWFHKGSESTNVTPQALREWAAHFGIPKEREEEFVTFMMRIYSVVGLMSEMGELADMAKKHMRNGPIPLNVDPDSEGRFPVKGWDLENLVEEVGDIEWYLATGLSWASADQLGLQVAMIRNREKLDARKAHGTLKEREGRGGNFVV